MENFVNQINQTNQINVSEIKNNIILDIEKKFICPLSKKIIRNPVEIKGLGIYEYECAEKLLYDLYDKKYDFNWHFNSELKLLIDTLEKNNYIDSNLRYRDYVIKENFDLDKYLSIQTVDKRIAYLLNTNLYSIYDNLEKIYNDIYTYNYYYDDDEIIRILENLIEIGINLHP